MKSNILKQCDFIETASVPVIKLECDLQMVQDDMRSQVAQSGEDDCVIPYVKLHENMRHLSIDLTFECVSDNLGMSTSTTLAI